MTEITYKRLDGSSETYYEAEDGEVFANREDCIEYEEKEIPLQVSAWGYLANDTRDYYDDVHYLAFDIPNEIALNTVNDWLKQGHHELIDKSYIGSRVLIGEDDLGSLWIAGTYAEMLRQYKERLDDLFGNFT